MRKKYFKLSALAALLTGSTAALAMPFNSFDPRSMSMGSTGVAIGDPATAPFFNPALLTASDPSLKYSIEPIIIGGRLYDPSNMHTNLSTLADTGTALTAAGNTLSTNSTALSTSITTLNANILTMSSNITGLAAINITTPAQATAALTSLNTLSTNLTTITGNISNVSNNSTTVGGNASTVSTNVTKVNQLLNSLNNQPLQGEFGAATVLGIPGKTWGFAVYADAWGAMGGTLEYNDSATVTTITTALNTTSTALNSTGTATGLTSTALGTANTSLSTAITSCTGVTAGTLAACQAALTAAKTDLGAAQTSMNNTSTTVATNATSVTNAAGSVNTNTTLQSKIHLRGVFVSEAGLSISHGFVTSDHTWSLGITPKVMQLQLFDALLSANNGTSTTGVTGNDYLAKYSTMNFDVGVAKSYNNGWRTGLVVKNVLPQTFDFKSIAPGAAAGSAQSTTGTLTMNPQVRTGLSHSNNWSTVALDLDLTRNNPAGLENQSQFAALGGELSAWGWAQIRAGYRADLLNPGQELISMGFGLSPRIPYFKPHLDFAVTASKDILTNGWNNATQVGASIKAGFNF